jgi:hypothetical protein
MEKSTDIHKICRKLERHSKRLSILMKISRKFNLICKRIPETSPCFTQEILKTSPFNQQNSSHLPNTQSKHIFISTSTNFVNKYTSRFDRIVRKTEISISTNFDDKKSFGHNYFSEYQIEGMRFKVQATHFSIRARL